MEAAQSSVSTPAGAQASARNNKNRGRGQGNGPSHGGGGRRRAGQSERAKDNKGGGERSSTHNASTRPKVAPTVPTAATPANGNTTGQDDEGDLEAEVCFICASPVVHNCVAPCNHRTCHICSLRLRALYKNKACAHCRTTADTVIFTDDATKRFEDFVAADFQQQDPNLGINYETTDIYEDTVLLLRYNCPDPVCDAACLGWPDLHRHVRSVHHKVMCDLCTRNKKVFTHEHDLFTGPELKKHEKSGDDTPGNQSGFKGHPECGFCRQRFYGDDELYAHCRDRHERCHLCDRRTGGRQPQYYVDYNALELHFRKDHFVCPDQECLEKKFVVFDSEMDLKAHQLEAHPNGLTKDAKRDARRVDISGFDYRAPHQQDRPRREGRGRGRGRDPNAEPIPASSAQPLRRDELAYQRQMAIQSSQSVTSRNFGGQLSQPEAFAARPPPNTQAPSTITAPMPSNPDALSTTLTALSLDPATAASLSPQEQARRLRHAAVVERAAQLLKNDSRALADFRTKISAYQSGPLSATALIDWFFSTFDCPPAELSKLIKELADIFEQPSKRDALLAAWSDWKAINEDYPSLPGPNGHGPASSGPARKTWASSLSTPSGPSTAPKAPTTRVLRLKSSTAQSSRRLSGTASNPFPALPPPAAPVLSIPPVRSSRPAWFDSIPSAAPNMATTKILSAPASGRASPAPTSGPPPSVSRDLFPALPKGAKPTSSVFSPGYSGAGVRRVNGPVGTSAWGASTPPQQEAAVSEGEGKKKKGKKTVLYNWG